jgi:hypothetical protein
MKPQPCFEPNGTLEEAARQAELRKNRAIERLAVKLSSDCTAAATADLIITDKRAQQEKAR